jgi:hypothetical protein
MSGANQTMPEDLAAVIATADPIPFDLIQSLRASLGRRCVDAEVAELIYDSVLDGQGDVRSLHGTRQLSFQGSEVSVEMEVVPERRRVVGQLIPPTRGQVEMRHGLGADVVAVDSLGRFVVEDVPKGPVSFRCRGNGEGTPVVTVTDWIVL